MRNLLMIPALLLLQLSAMAQILLGTSGYTQDFNSLAVSGTSSTLPSWWVFYESGTNANGLYNSGNGSSNAGDTYSFGTGTDPDRALGTLQSGSLISQFGASFLNNTGSTITSITITFIGEQWRCGTTGRTDSLYFSYAIGNSFPYVTNWIFQPDLHVASPNTAGPVGALDGNSTGNRILKTATITGLNFANFDTLAFRWTDFNASGADDGLAIDSLVISVSAAPDLTPPAINSLNPANGAVNVSINPVLTMTFSEPVKKGAGNILVKKFSDNSTSSTIDVNSTVVTISGAVASISVSGLALNTQYYVEMASGVFKDLANNDFAGISGNSTWNFTTSVNPQILFDFNSCSPFGAPGSGWTSFNVTGDSLWKCTSFGVNNSAGAQMSGFVNPAGPAVNEDWLISPALNLTSFSIPVLSFMARTKFYGNRIDVLVSTNYPGSGNPNSSAWTILTAALPLENSDIWTSVDSINLAPYKTSATYIAFRYTSTTAAAARWTIDNVQISGFSNPPGPLVQVTDPVVNFDYVQQGTISPARSFEFAGLNFSSGLTITAPTTYQISKDNLAYSTSLNFSQSDLSGGYKKIYIRYVPVAVNLVNTGKLNFSSSSGYNKNFTDVTGNSYAYNSTLDIVTWNIEWFGSTTNGPADDNLQQANVKRVMDSLQADIYALCEIVDTTRLKNLANSLTGYSYKISDYCSNAPDPASPNYATGQKLAFIYKTAVVTNVKVRGLLKTSSTANSNWASGRFPYLLEADIANGTASKKYHFILIHGKAGSTNSDYQRRKDGAKELKDSLDAFFNTSQIVILGDFNDDLDSTISMGIAPPRLTSYDDIVKDSTDADHYRSISLPLSRAGLRSTISNPEVIDHVILSNELQADYLTGSARMIREVESWIPDFENTTSDHYPLMSRTLMPAQVTGINNITAAEIELILMPNPVTDLLNFRFKPKPGMVKIDLIDLNGIIIKSLPPYRSASFTQSVTLSFTDLAAGLYILRIQNEKTVVSVKVVKIH